MIHSQKQCEYSYNPPINNTLTLLTFCHEYYFCCKSETALSKCALTLFFWNKDNCVIFKWIKLLILTSCFLFLFRSSKRISENWGNDVTQYTLDAQIGYLFRFHKFWFSNLFLSLFHQDIWRIYHWFGKCGFWQSVSWVYILILLFIHIITNISWSVSDPDISKFRWVKFPFWGHLLCKIFFFSWRHSSHCLTNLLSLEDVQL